MKLTWKDRFNFLFRGQLSTVFHETDSTIAIGRGFNSDPRDRYDYDRAAVLQDSLDAWRLNPLARRIVELTTQYVVGAGITINCKHEATLAFINAFWQDRLNRMEVRTFELCDELTRSGNLFVLLSTDAAGMSYVRCIPAYDIEAIESRPNDVEQPRLFHHKASALQRAAGSSTDDLDPAPYRAYDLDTDGPDENGAFSPVVLQYTINRPVGGQWGESDLAPSLKWLSRYAAWLEDRARLNRFRNAFLFVVKSRFASETERAARQAALAANPPAPGSILVTDESEEWSVISPELAATDANTDGLALKKMIAAGSGIPMHFLAEPEGTNRTTAESAGGPTYRHFEQRQKYFLWIMQDILRVAVNRRSLVDRHVSRKAAIEVRGADISARDNVSLAMAANNIQAVLAELRRRGLIDNDEFLRVIYRFCGEWVDIPQMRARARAEGLQPIDENSMLPFPGGKGLGDRSGAGTGVKPKPNNNILDPDTGDLKPTVADPEASPM